MAVSCMAPLFASWVKNQLTTVLAFCYCDKILIIYNLMEERFILAHSSEVSVHGHLPQLLRCAEGRNIMVEEYGRGKLLTSWMQEVERENGKPERKRAREKGARSRRSWQSSAHDPFPSTGSHLLLPSPFNKS